MATKIVTKNSSTASAVPTASDLVQGELAVNVADKRLFTEDNGGAIVELGTNPSSLTVTGEITADGLTVDGTGNLGTIGNGAFNAAAALGFQSNRAFFGYSSSQSALIQSGASKGVVVEVNSDTLDSGTRAALFAPNGDISFYEDTGTTAKLTWSASEEALTIGGQLKLKYTGSTSLISGGDALRLRATNEIKIQNFNSTETMAQFIPAGAATLNYANSPKIATTSTGIDVTGTATMDGLTVEAASNALIRISDSTSSNQRLDLQHNSGVASIISGNNGAYGVIKLQAYNGTDTVERMRIDGSGNVGIGTTSPTDKLEVNGNIKIDTGTADGGQLILSSAGYSDWNNDNTNGAWRLYNGSTERMRIDSSGNLLVGQTAQNYNVVGASIGSDGLIRSANTGQVTAFNRKGSHGAISVFYKDGVTVGSISTNANSLPSDRNFKRNIQDLTLGLDFVESLNPVTYNFKIDDEGQAVMTGLIAQEVEEALTAAGVEKNSMTLLQHKPTEDVNESDYQMDYLKFVPILINSIKEQQTLIESLTARIAALEE